VAIAPEIGSLDPHRQHSHGGLATLGNVYEALTAFDDETRLVPGLALRWESLDELTWRFHLRQGVAFHDGRPLSAQDVVASLERARRAGRSAHGGLASVGELSALADDVVQIRTTRSSPMLLNGLATAFVVPRDAPDEVEAPIGTGPYRFVRFDPQVGLELSVWDRYWGGRAMEPSLSFRFEADPERRLRMLASGAVDVALRLSETADSDGRSGYRLLSRPAPGARVLGLRVDERPFSDARVRRAVHLAVDRSSVCRELLGGRARPIGQMLTPGIFGFVPDLPAPARELEAARRLVAEASGGAGLALTLDHGRGRRREAEALASQLGEAGFQVALHELPVSDLLRGLESGRARMVLMSYVYAPGDAVDVFESIFHGRDAARGFGAENGFGYCNPRVDALIEAGAAASTMEARLASYQQAMRLVAHDLPIVPLWEVPWVYGVRDGIEWTPAAHGWFRATAVRRR
jgi:peptide/nickel transport system substrate-binding protein